MFVRLATRCGVACILTLLAGSFVDAQIINGHQWPVPRLTIITPAGGKAGTTVEVGFTGTELEDPISLLFSHPGIKGTPIKPPPGKKADPKDPKKMIEFEVPITKFSVVIDKSVPLGYHDVRFVNKNGVSNPRRFIVGDLNEVAEKEPNNDVEQAQKVELGTTITGTITAGTDVDYYSFAGKKGQRVVIACLTASIDSRLDPEIRVLFAGRDLASYRPFPGQDGIIDVTLPEDGDYLIRLNKFTYTVANAEFFYRLNISTAPQIDAVFPPIVEAGKATQVTVYGRNLPGGKLDPQAAIQGHVLEKVTVNVAAPGDPASLGRLSFTGLITPLMSTLDGFDYRVTGPGGASNPLPLFFSKAPVVLENDDNDTPEKAQVVPVPCEIAGRIDKLRDRDWYTFDAKKGDVLMIELMSHRMGAGTDMYFSLRNPAAKGAEITLQDDNPDSLSLRFYTANNRDPAPYRFVVPADGKYQIMAASHTGDNYADPTHVYRLRITPEKPDFRLFVMPPDETRPDTCRLGQGGSHHYTVYAQRIDGFKGDIVLTVDGLPAGVTCPPQVLSGSMKMTQLVLTAADTAAEFTGTVKVTGTATLGSAKLVHEARPASVTWGVQQQQNIPTITRLDRELMLAIRDKAPGKLVPTKDKVVVSIGDKIDIPLKLTRSFPEFKANLQVAPIAVELPPGLTFANLTFAPGKDDINAVVTVGANVPPGKYNLAFRGFAPIQPNAKAKPVNTLLISQPVELTVLPKQVATLTVDNGNPTVKAGAETTIVVKVARQFDYADAFKVELVLPPNIKGVAADNITIGPGQNEAKMLLRVLPGTPPAALANLTIRATAVVNGNVNLVHEVKINVNVAK